MNENNKEFMKAMDGQEIWTDAFGKRFGERVCVGIDGIKIVCNGKKFTPTDKEMKELKNDRLRQEYGTTDFKKIMKMEGF